MDKVVTFKVTVKYETDEEKVDIDHELLKDHLFNALERERQEGALTPNDVSANWIKVDAND